MFRSYPFLFAGLIAAGLAPMSGCGRGQAPAPTAGTITQATAPKAASEPEKHADHAHKPGAHGGIIASLGRDSYHAEAVFEIGGILRLYTLGKDEARVQEVENQTLKGYAKAAGDTESVEIELKPTPQDGDSPGKTSRFTAQLPKDLAGKKVEVTIPSLRIGGERFRLGFASAHDSGHEAMPEGVSADEARKLYLTPGGIYTEADIEANGRVTPAQKFKGLVSRHDLKPKPGDKICPVTLTKANPVFSWIVAGKKYEFCCPPCLDEFVATAKSNPTEILEPQEYVKKGATPVASQVPAIQVSRVKLSAEDLKAVVAQEWCPVSQERFGVMGVPPKINLKGRTVFLCCRACRDKAEAKPDETLARVEEFHEVQAVRTKLSPEERKLVDAQDVCVVMTDNKLGSMGPPVKLLIQGQPVFICCQGCARAAQANPEKSLRKKVP